MNRRSFLKSIAGFSLGIAGTQLALPISAKCKMLAPVTEVVGKAFLDRRIKKSIAKLKQANPYLKLGETHCHSIYSDGTYTVDQIMNRAAKLGLDFLIITEHITPGYYPLEDSLTSIKERWRCCQEWNNPKLAPIEVYPAFEVSTEQGHLILVMDQDYLKPQKLSDLRTQFAPCENKMVSMEKTAKMVKPFGGVSIIPHPDIARSYPFGVPISFAKQNLTGLVDAIEDISTGHGFDENYSDELGMASIGSSDDHFNLIIGTTVTGYDSRRHKNFLSAVKARDTQAIKVNDSLDDLMEMARIIL
jgi:PHP domain-containing protein